MQHTSGHNYFSVQGNALFCSCLYPARVAFTEGEVCNPVCCNSNKMAKVICWNPSRILMKKAKYFWYKLIEIYFLHTDLLKKTFVEFMTSQVCEFTYLKNLNIAGMKKYFKMVNSYFLPSKAIDDFLTFLKKFIKSPSQKACLKFIVAVFLCGGLHIILNFVIGRLFVLWCESN